MSAPLQFSLGIVLIAFPMLLMIALALKDKPPVATAKECLGAAVFLTVLVLVVGWGLRLLCTL